MSDKQCIAGSKIRAIIFDMDGTLIQSTKIDYKAWLKVARDFNRDFMSYDEYKKLLGVRSSDVFRTYFNLEGEELQKGLEKRMKYIKEIVSEDGLFPVPHAEQFLEEARSTSLKTALATGARREKLNLVLQNIDLKKYFDVIVTGDDADRGKPDPDIFLEAAKQLNISPHEAVVIEDAENGVKAAKNAGMHCIAITTTTPAERLGQADIIIDSFKDNSLCQIISRIRA